MRCVWIAWCLALTACSADHYNGVDLPRADGGAPGGTTPGADGGAGCAALTCADLGANCGEVEDGCGGTLQCGECSGPAVCGGRGRENLCAIPEGDRECDADGWCFENPAPQPMRPLAMSAPSAGEVWAVGERGAIAHFDGERWGAMSAGAGAHLRGVWSAGISNVWAVGDGGAFLHWDGETWSPVEAAQGDADLGGVSGTGADDVWVVGDGITLHHDGATWLPAGVATPDLDHLFAAPSGDVWATGEGRVWRWNGAGWSGETPGPGLLTAFRIHGIHGRSSSDVWAVGRQHSLFSGSDIVYRFDGVSWERLETAGDPWLFDAFGTPARTFSAGGNGVNVLSGGPAVPELDESVAQGAAVGDSVTTMTSDGEPIRLAGGSWIRDGFGLRTEMVALGAAGNRVWVGGGGALLEWTGAGFLEHRPGSNSGTQFWSVAGTAVDDVWAIEGTYSFDTQWLAEAIWHWDGATWTYHGLPQNGFSPMHVVRPTSAGVLVAGEGAIYRRQGETWEEAHGSSTVWYSIDESSEGVWSVGSRPGDQETDGTAVIGRLGATGWTEIVVPGTNVLCGLDVVSENDIWAAGYRTLPDGDDFGSDPDPRGTISHWDGQSWSTVELSAAKLCSTIALDANDVYATGAGSALYHFDGENWTSRHLIRTGSLRALLIAGEELWAAGDHGAVLRRSNP